MHKGDSMKQELTIAEQVARQYAIGYKKGEGAVLKTMPFQVQSAAFIAGALKTELAVVKGVYIQTTL